MGYRIFQELCPEKRIKGVLFDMDGVVLDTEKLYTRFWREAALALGLSKRQAMFRIVIPQAFKNSIPVFGNYLVMLVKDTSLMAYITAQEFLMTTKAYTSQTFLTIESYTILAGVYLVICIPLALLVKYVERISNKSKR